MRGSSVSVMSGEHGRRGKRFKKDAIMSHMQDVGLCEAVANNPCIYDLKHPHFKDMFIRDEVWDKIGTQMDLPGDVCKRRWRNIRDCYRRNKREEKACGVLKISKKKKWFLYDHLNFLESTEDDRGSTMNVQESDPLKYEDEDEAEGENSLNKDEEIIDHEDGYPVENEYQGTEYDGVCTDNGPSNSDPTDILELSTIPPAAVRSRRLQRRAEKKLINVRRKRVLKRNADLTVNRRLEKERSLDGAVPGWGGLPSRPQEELTTEDETDVFFRSMAMTAKRLHPVLLARLKKQVCNYVMDAQVENSTYASEICNETPMASQ